MFVISSFQQVRGIFPYSAIGQTPGSRFGRPIYRVSKNTQEEFWEICHTKGFPE